MICIKKKSILGGISERGSDLPIRGEVNSHNTIDSFDLAIKNQSEETVMLRPRSRVKPSSTKLVKTRKTERVQLPKMRGTGTDMPIRKNFRSSVYRDGDEFVNYADKDYYDRRVLLRRG